MLAKEETDIVHRIMLSESKNGTVLHKNVRGTFKTLDGKRFVKAGLLADGASDLVGYTPTVITENMLGKTLAVYTVFEVKTFVGVKAEDQKNFVARVKARGGRAGFARSPQEANKIKVIPV